MLRYFANFVEYIHENGCTWTNNKTIGFTKLEFDYLHSNGGKLNQFNSNKIKFGEIKTKNIYNCINEENWYFRLIRNKRFFRKDYFGKINDFKRFIRWKRMAYWVPIAINLDINNIFNLNKYLIGKVSTKFKVKIDIIDVYSNLDIHICQLIPDILKYIFRHYLNLASIILISFRDIKLDSLEQWKYNHEILTNIHLVYEKLQ